MHVLASDNLFSPNSAIAVGVTSLIKNPGNVNV